MITFNLQAGISGNYYRGHEPSSNCWGDEDVALVLTIEQAREIVKAWPGRLSIVIAVSVTPMSPYSFDHEMFCIRGGNWYHYRHRSRLNKQKHCSHHMRGQDCKFCGARHSEGGYWCDPETGTTINEELVT